MKLISTSRSLLAFSTVALGVSIGASQAVAQVTLTTAIEVSHRDFNPSVNSTSDAVAAGDFVVKGQNGKQQIFGLIEFDRNGVTAGAGQTWELSFDIEFSQNFGAVDRTLALYAIPDLDAKEDLSANITPGVTTAITGTGPGGTDNTDDKGYSADTTGGLNYANYTTQLDSFVWPMTTTGTASFSSVALDSFIANDTNDILTFAIVAVAGTTSGQERITTNTLSLNTVPEPSTYAAIAGVLVLGLAVLRRRVRR